MIDLKKNKISGTVKKIHLTAICGTAMGALASMLKDLGYTITGSDQTVYPPMSNFLLKKGIKILGGYHEDHLLYKPDLVIVGNTISKDNPEVIKLQEMGLNFCSMPQALNTLVSKGKKRILLTGTHGKTTTSSLMSWILHEAGLDPSFMIGGILQNFNSNYRLGNGEHIVIEGDEYDTAFFDKGAKFFHYDPYIAVLGNIEFDHADIFKDLDHVKDTFQKFVSNIPKENTLLAFEGNKNVSDVIEKITCNVIKYGKGKDSFYRLGKVIITPPWNQFEVIKNGKKFGTFKTNLVGEHNLLNILAVIGIADLLNISKKIISNGLQSFKSVKKRQEIRGIKNNITVMDDFAHHPTAVFETIKAVKPFYPNGQIIAVFEPRTNSSMRNIFQETYIHSFEDADIICIREPSLLNKIPENERFSSEKLTNDLISKGKKAYYFPDTEKIIDFIVQNAKQDDLVLIMSNGGFDNIHEKLLKKL